MTLTHEIRGQFPAREPYFESHLLRYCIPSLVAIVRGIKSLMRIGFLYYNCLGFDLASGYTLHYTEYCSGSSLQRMISPGHRALVVLKRSAEVHLVVGS